MEKRIINIRFTFKKMIKRSRIYAEISDQGGVLSSTGKILANKKAFVVFPGYAKIASTSESFIDTFSTVVSGTCLGTLFAAGSSFSFSGFFSNALMSLSKLVQIIEFSAFMELYNISYEEVMGKFLQRLSQAVNVKLLGSPTKGLVQSTQHSKAGTWKGKLSQVGVEPLLLQDLGYLGLIMIVKIIPNWN